MENNHHTPESLAKMLATRKKNKALRAAGKMLPYKYNTEHYRKEKNPPVPTKELHPEELPVVMLGNPHHALQDFTSYIVLAWKLYHQ